MHVRTRTWFSVVVVASLLFMLASRFTVFDPLESAVLAAVAPVESGLRTVTQPVADFVNNLTDINRLSNDNRSLRQENERLRAENARLNQSEDELRQLRQLLQVRGEDAEESFVSGNVIAREPSNVRDLLALNRGSKDGLRKGMIVLTRQGSLVGSVTSVLDHTAWVTLISDQTSAVSGVVQDSNVQGVVAGSANGTLTMEFVQETADVKEGDVVLTSGVGGRYPAGELIGQVVDVQRTAQELFQSVHIESLADLSALDRLFVLTSFLPQEPGAP